jgi:ribosomal protein S18 acetylase RimI-like enzyme
MTDLNLKIGTIPKTEEIIKLYDNSGIKRPTIDPDRISKMYSNSNLVVSAWSNNELVGISRALTDFSYACYLSDLAIKKEYQKFGLGKKLIELTQKEIGDKVALILLSSPTAMGYYPKVGFAKIDNGFIIKRAH